MIENSPSAPSQWATSLLTSAGGPVVILDTETTALDGAVCEIAIVCARTGTVLLDTLVDPRVPISAEARAVHGIADDDVAGAPLWPQVHAAAEEACRGATVLAYNAQFDYERIEFECSRWGLTSPVLGDERNWDCLMLRRSEWLGRRRRHLRLNGGHRALGDVYAAAEVLWRMRGDEATRGPGCLAA